MGFWNLFKRQPNITDWEIVWRDTGMFEKWGWNSHTDETAIYEIYHSPSTNQYKLVTKGFHPKNHSMYQTALNKLSEYQLSKSN